MFFSLELHGWWWWWWWWWCKNHILMKWWSSKGLGCGVGMVPSDSFPLGGTYWDRNHFPRHWILVHPTHYSYVWTALRSALILRRFGFRTPSFLGSVPKPRTSPNLHEKYRCLRFGQKIGWLPIFHWLRQWFIMVNLTELLGITYWVWNIKFLQ